MLNSTIFFGLIIAILGSNDTIPWAWGKGVGYFAVVVLFILMIFQLILGIRQIGIDNKVRKDYKERYRLWQLSLHRARTRRRT